MIKKKVFFFENSCSLGRIKYPLELITNEADMKEAISAPSKSFTRIFIIFLVFSLLSIGLQQAEFANANEQFASGDILAMIQIVSPADRGSYTGNVLLKVSIEFSGYSISESTVIPHQDFNCIYRLDADEWRNASLESVSETRTFMYIANRKYWIGMNCTYNATLPALPSGAHSIDIKVKPEAIHSFDIRTYNGGYGPKYHYSNSTVNFYFIDDSEPTAPTDQPTDQTIPTIVFSTGIISVIIISAIVVLSRRKK